MKKLLLTISIITTLLFTQGIALAAGPEGIPGGGDTTDFASDTDPANTGGIVTEPTDAPVNPEAGDGEDLESLEGDGVRIDNGFKPINAPEAFNRNYTTSTVNAFLQFIAGSIIQITSAVAIFVLVIAGFMFVTAAGDQGRVDKAKEVVKYTIFGMFVVILSFTIVKTIISLTLEVDGL